jgi:hypothetical protein
LDGAGTSAWLKTKRKTCLFKLKVMKTNFYLVVNKRGTVRTVKEKPDLKWDEVSVKMALELPNVLFDKPQLSASLIVGEDQAEGFEISPDVTADIKDAIESAAGIEVKLQVVNNQ